MKDEKVLRRVFEHAAYVDTQIGGHQRIFTALQGSQNYQLDDEFSDVDTKSLVIPAFESLVFNKKRMSTTVEVAPTIEHADIKDVREMFDCFRKQNINFIEILFTKYVDINPMFVNFYEELYANREAIAHYNPYQALRAMCGHMMEKYHAFDHPYPSIIDKIEKYGYDPKQLHHLLRFKEFLIRYFKDESYEDCLVSKDIDYLIAVKRGVIPLPEALKLREEAKNWMDKFLNQKRTEIPNEYNVQTGKLMDDLIYDVFKTCYSTNKMM